MADPNEHVRTYLRYFVGLADPPGFAVLLKGSWGSGKTFQIKHMLRQELRGHVNGIVYVSLYGLKSADEIDQMLLEAALPLFANKKLKLTGRIAARFLSRGRVDQTVIRPDEIYSIDPAKLYVFDDLERSAMRIDEALGYINKIVEHQSGRVVVIANEAEIKEDGYLGRKDKLIGQTLEVFPDFDAAFEVFLGVRDIKPSGPILQAHREIISRIFLQSQTDNLRLLWQVMSDFARLDQVLTAEIRENRGAIESLVRIFFALGFEYRAGRIKEEDLSRRTPEITWRGLGEKRETKPIQIASDRYVGTYLAGQILTDGVLTDVLARGVVNPDDVLKAIHASEFFKSMADQPAWRRVWWGHSTPEAEFEKAVAELETQFAERSIISVGELLHVFGLRIWLSEIGAIPQTREDIQGEGLKYIDDLYAEKRLEALEPGMIASARHGGFGGLAIQSVDQPEYKKLLEYLREKQSQAAKDQHPEKAVALMTNLRDDVRSFGYSISQDFGDGKGYAHIPILLSIDPEEFVDVLVKHEPPALDTLFGGLKARYQFGKLRGELKDEEDWLKSVLAKITAAAEFARPLKKHILKQSVLGLENSIWGDEESNGR